MQLRDYLRESPEFAIFVVLGPTATGKTDFACRLSEKINAEIISFDSVQVFREMDIGTAKPSRALREQVVHHLIDIVNPDEAFTAGDFRMKALSLIEEIKKRNKNVVLVGGTGFYLSALLDGMFEGEGVPEDIKAFIRQRFDQEGPEALFQELKTLDPEYALRIHPNDSYRVCRGLEVLKQHGKTPSQLRLEFNRTPLNERVIKLGLDCDKKDHSEIVRRRTQKMIHDGLVEEVGRLMEKYPQPWPKALSSVGYKETLEYIQTQFQTPLQDHIVSSTLKLAKRQRTWFKRDKNIEWSFNQGDEFIKLIP